MTERLTEKIINKVNGEILGYRIKGVYAEYSNNKLKALQKLGELETAEEEGRLVVLPCKVGTTVYVIDYTWNYGEIGDKAKRNYFIKRMSFVYGMINVFNKTVFLTRKEAEKALKEMNKNE